MTFARRYPALFHVADHAALDGIHRHGLLSAAGLVALHRGDLALLGENRRTYVDLAPGAALRRQGMRDKSLRPRLHSSIKLEEWRGFINGLVFLFPSEPSANRFVQAEPDRDQIVLRYATADLLGAGLALKSCSFNNGYIDRSPIATARKRHFDDYRDIANWSHDPVKEVVSPAAIPRTVRFDVLPPP